MDNNSKKDNLEKMANLESKNVNLEEQIKSYEDPNEKPKIVRRGHVNKGIKFQKN